MVNHSKKGYQHERRVNKKKGWFGVSGSGSKWHSKEDSKSHYNYQLDEPNTLIQIKYTGKPYYILKLEDLKTLEKNATLESRDWFLYMTLQDTSFVVRPYYGTKIPEQGQGAKSMKLYLNKLDKYLIDKDLYVVQLKDRVFSIERDSNLLDEIKEK